MRAAEIIDHSVVLRDEHGYFAHPHLIRAGDALLVVCNWAPRRRFVLHPPEDPLYLNLLLRSVDEGISWSAPVVAPAYGWSGVECAGLTDLGQDRLLLNQWRFDWLTLPAAQARKNRSGITFPEQLVAGHLGSSEHDDAGLTVTEAEQLLPWARAPGRAWAHLSQDGGRTWSRSVEIDTAPFVGGYGMRGGVVLPDGTIVLPLCDIPDYRRVFVITSRDGGLSWSPPVGVAEVAGRLFEEPAPLLLRTGRLLILMRENTSKSLWRTWSDDAGRSWAAPTPTGIDGYPAHLAELPDGRVLCTYGFRRPPFAIRAVVLNDAMSVDGDVIEIRDELPTKDLGYPCTTQAGTELLTVYYARDRAGLTGIHATRWKTPV